MAEQPDGGATIERLLLWARANKFRVREVQVGETRLVVDDIDSGPPPKFGPPQSIHKVWADVLNVPYSETDDDDDGEARS
jgi:hypothetical protein